MEYRKRIVDEQLSQALRASGAVLLEGARACGKTVTAMQLAKSHANLDTDLAQRRLAETLPAIFLEGETPRLIDEWQVVKSIWNQVRRAVDERQLKGQFILTGSAQSADDQITHSGAGRIMRIRMRPMSLFESGFSNGQVSLASLLSDQPEISARNEFEFVQIVDEICRGGWPAFQGVDVVEAQAALKSYLEDVVRSDFSSVTAIAKDSNRVRRVLKALARNVGSEISVARLASEVGSIELHGIKPSTLESYIEVLRGVMVIEDLQPWATHLRSKAIVRQSLKRYFVDPSLVVAALEATPEKLIRDLNTLGFLFENLVIRDLRVYAQSLRGRVAHYRDSSGLEVDVIVEAADGAWAAFEIKLGDYEIDKAAKNLLKLRDQVDKSKVGAPLTLGVITAGGHSYRRSDGVAVISIGTLGP